MMCVVVVCLSPVNHSMYAGNIDHGVERDTRRAALSSVSLNGASRAGRASRAGATEDQDQATGAPPRHQGLVHGCTSAQLTRSTIHLCVVDSYHNKHADRTLRKYLISAFATTMRTTPAIADLPQT